MNYKNVNLDCVLQPESNWKEKPCLHGILSRKGKDGGSFLFEETTPQKDYVRNPKLYDGKLVSLVRKKDGRYQPHLKTLEMGEGFSASDYAFRVYSEICSALGLIKSN